MSKGLTKSNGVLTEGEAAAGTFDLVGGAKMAEEDNSVSRDGGVLVVGDWAPDES